MDATGQMQELRKEGLLACRDLAGDDSGFTLRMFANIQHQRGREAWAGPAGHSVSRLEEVNIGERVRMGGRKKKVRGQSKSRGNTATEASRSRENVSAPQRVFSSLFLIRVCFLEVKLFLISTVRD